MWSGKDGGADQGTQKAGNSPANQEQEPEAEVPDVNLRTGLDRVLAEGLRPIWVGFGFLYALLAVSHILVLDAAQARVMAPLAATTALIMLGLRLWNNRHPIPKYWPHPLGALTASLVLMNSLAHFYLTGEPRQTTNLLLFLVGTGFLFLSRPWVIFFILFSLLAWGGVILLLPPSNEWGHYGFAVFSAVILAIVVHEVRLRMMYRLEWHRLREVRQKTAMAAALVATEESRQTLTKLMEAAHALGRTLELEEVLGVALDQLIRVVPYDGAAVLLVEGAHLWVRAWRGPVELDQAVPVNYPIEDNSLLAEIFHSGSPLALPDAQAHPDWPAALSQSWFRGWIGAPLVAEGVPVGMLTVFSRQVGIYGEQESRWVGTFADYAATAMRNATLVTGTQKALEQADFLYEAVRMLTTTLETDTVLQNLLDLLCRHFHPDAVSIALLESDGTLFFRMASGQVGESICGLRLPPDTGIVGWVARTGEPAWIPEVESDPRFYNGVDNNSGFATRTIYAVPIRVGDQILAVLELLNLNSRLVTEETRELVMALAAAAAPAIQNARLFEQVRRTEERYQQLFHLNQNPVVILDEYGRVREINQAVRALLPIDEVPAFQALSVLGLSPVRFLELQRELEERPLLSWEARLVARDGRTHTLEVHLTRLNNYTTGGAYQWLAHDMTDRVALEEMREQLSHMIVHDLRNPLSSIMSSLELLRSGTEDDPQGMIREVLPIAQNSARRMDQLIGTILDTARLRAGENILNPTSFSVTEMIEGVAAGLQFSLSLRQQSLVVEVSPDLPLLTGDFDLLRRVLINLLDNSIKFSPLHGRIQLSVRKAGREFWFSVQDTGPGIPKEEHEQIFELFARGHQQRKVKGSGVGLAFCKLVVEAHGGRIWVESVPGEGSRFTFTVPALFLPTLETETPEQSAKGDA